MRVPVAPFSSRLRWKLPHQHRAVLAREGLSAWRVVAATAGSVRPVCSACGHRAVVRAGTPARSPTVARDEQAAERAAQARLAAQ